MRLILALLGLMLCWEAGAATKWVDLTGTGSGAADGSDINNQCAGIGDADCIGANLPAGSTMHMCNALTGAGITIPVAGSAGNVTTYDCVCTGGTNGSITATSGTAGILANKAYTRVGDSCSVSYTGSKPLQINASNVTIGSVRIVSPGQDGITLTTPTTLTNITIDGASVSGMTRYGVIWQNSNSTTNSATDFIIQNSTFSGNANSGIFFQCNFQATDCTIVRLSITGNTVTGGGNTGIVVQDCYDGDVSGTCADPTSYTLARYTDVSITNNTVTGQTAGGGIALYGCKSSTLAYGKCVISGNNSSNNNGPTGGIDLFNSQYVTVFQNVTNNNSTATIDGNGILIDYGNKNVLVYRNESSFNQGRVATENSGLGYMCLKCDTVSFFGNVGTNNRSGMYFSGGSFVEAAVSAYNNTLLANTDYGIYFDSTQDASSTTIYNSIITGPGTCIYVEASGTINVEDYNNLGCTTRKNYNSVGWSDGANSTTGGAGLINGGTINTTNDYRLGGASTNRRTGKELGIGNYPDFFNRAFNHPPSIGAVESASGDSATTRTAATRIAATRSAATTRTAR